MYARGTKILWLTQRVYKLPRGASQLGYPTAGLQTI